MSRPATAAGCGRGLPPTPGPPWPASLLIVVILGIRATLPAATTGPWHAHGFVLAASLDILLAVMLVVVRRRRRRPASYPASELRTWLTNILALAVAVITVLALLALFKVQFGPIRPAPLKLKLKGGGLPATHLPRPPHGSASSLPGYLLYAVAGLLVLAAIGGCLYLLWSRRTRQPDGLDADVEVVTDDTALRAAVASGRSALQAVDDARAAIIACYVAMETRLAGAGAARTVAETPDELLERAQRTGLLRGEAAPRLVSLFYEARFSTHPLPASARDRAAEALDAISAELDTSRLASAAGGAA